LWGNYIWNSSRVCLYGSLYDERCSPAKYCRIFFPNPGSTKGSVTFLICFTNIRNDSTLTIRKEMLYDVVNNIKNTMPTDISIAHYIHWSYLLLIPMITIITVPFLMKLLKKEVRIKGHFDIKGYNSFDIKMTFYPYFFL
jgi:hypothetical protein